MPIRYFDFRENNSWKTNPFFQKAKQNSWDVLDRVKDICTRILSGGDSELKKMTKDWDGVELDSFVLRPQEISVSIPSNIQAAFRKAIENITAFHEAQTRKEWSVSISGNTLGVKYTPVDSVSVYAPGGKALYPSSVLMGVIPAKIAGVPTLQLVTPPQKQGLPPILVWLAKELGISKIITLGGAQAIAAVAYGTETISRSDFVVGPGNSYVACAKSYLSGLGVIGIDSPAGPSEVLVIADETANPEWVACDLLSQAEHGEDSSCLLATTSPSLIESVKIELQKALDSRPKRKEMKQAALDSNSALCLFSSLEECIDFSNFIGPEHLEIQTKEPRKTFQSIRHAGSVFLGPFSPVAMGDYISGTNHILPTAGGSRIYSSLGVDSFLKRVTYQEITRESLTDLYPHVKLMSELEGLDEEHGTSVKVRLKAN